MQDFVYACRLIWRTPVLSGISIVALALGIGATTALFSVVQAVLLRPLPYMEPERLVQVVARSARDPNREVSPFREVLTGAEADSLARLTDVFAGVTVFELWTTDWSPRFAMSGVGHAERVRGAHVDGLPSVVPSQTSPPTVTAWSSATGSGSASSVGIAAWWDEQSCSTANRA
jgi:putative ABC transport system permease protein